MPSSTLRHAGRIHFSVADDQTMCQFLYDELQQGNDDAESPCGLRIWKTAHKRNLLKVHSVDSLSTHARRHLLPHLHIVPLPKEILTRLTKSYNRYIKDPSKKSHPKPSSKKPDLVTLSSEEDNDADTDDEGGSINKKKPPRYNTRRSAALNGDNEENDKVERIDHNCVNNKDEDLPGSSPKRICDLPIIKTKDVVHRKKKALWDDKRKMSSKLMNEDEKNQSTKSNSTEADDDLSSVATVGTDLKDSEKRIISLIKMLNSTKNDISASKVLSGIQNFRTEQLHVKASQPLAADLDEEMCQDANCDREPQNAVINETAEISAMSVDLTEEGDFVPQACSTQANLWEDYTDADPGTLNCGPTQPFDGAPNDKDSPPGSKNRQEKELTPENEGKQCDDVNRVSDKNSRGQSGSSDNKNLDQSDHDYFYDETTEVLFGINAFQLREAVKALNEPDSAKLKLALRKLYLLEQIRLKYKVTFRDIFRLVDLCQNLHQLEITLFWRLKKSTVPLRR